MIKNSEVQGRYEVCVERDGLRVYCTVDRVADVVAQLTPTHAPDKVRQPNKAAKPSAKRPRRPAGRRRRKVASPSIPQVTLRNASPTSMTREPLLVPPLRPHR
jgi:hypothetical protein